MKAAADDDRRNRINTTRIAVLRPRWSSHREVRASVLDAPCLWQRCGDHRPVGMGHAMAGRRRRIAEGHHRADNAAIIDPRPEADNAVMPTADDAAFTPSNSPLARGLRASMRVDHMCVGGNRH